MMRQSPSVIASNKNLTIYSNVIALVKENNSNSQHTPVVTLGIVNRGGLFIVKPKSSFQCTGLLRTYRQFVTFHPLCLNMGILKCSNA